MSFVLRSVQAHRLRSCAGLGKRAPRTAPKTPQWFPPGSPASRYAFIIHKTIWSFVCGIVPTSPHGTGGGRAVEAACPVDEDGACTLKAIRLHTAGSHDTHASLLALCGTAGKMSVPMHECAYRWMLQWDQRCDLSTLYIQLYCSRVPDSPCKHRWQMLLSS